MEFYSKSTMEKVGFSIQAIQQDVEDRQRREEESGALRFGETVPPTDNGEGILKGEDKPLSVGIITSSCNMYHAERMAEKFGLTDVCPMAVNTSEILLFYNYAEEALDVFKDKLVGNL